MRKSTNNLTFKILYIEDGNNYDFATEYFLNYFVKKNSSTNELDDEVFNAVYKTIYDFFVESEGALDFSEKLFGILKMISKYKLVIIPNYYKALLTLASIEGYLYYIKPGFNMIENARKRRLKMAEYATIPDDAVHIMLGDYGTYSNSMFREGFTPKQAYEERDRFILDEIALKAGEFVIDVGCGRGKLLKKMEEKGGRALGITVSKTEHETCLGMGLECIYTSWEEFDNTSKEAYPKADSMTVIEMLLHIGTLHDNRVGLTERRLKRFFSWAHGRLADNGRLFIQSINIVDKFLHHPEYDEYYRRVNGQLPWLGFTTFQQLVTCSEGYFTIERVYNHSADLLSTSQFIKSGIEDNAAELKAIIKPVIFHYMLEELEIGMELAESGIVKLYRTLLINNAEGLSSRNSEEGWRGEAAGHSDS